MKQHESEILSFLYTCNIKNDLFIEKETSEDKRTYRHYINLTGDYHEDDLIEYNDSIENLVKKFNISNIKQQDEYIVHDDNFSFINDRQYFFPKLDKLIEPVGKFVSHEISVETYTDYLKNNFQKGPLYLNYNNRNIALVRENITSEMKNDFMLQTDIFKDIMNKYPEYRNMLKHVIYPIDVAFNQRTKREKILEDIHSSKNMSISIEEYSPIYADSLRVYSFKKERYLTKDEFRITSENKYDPSLLDQMGLSVKYLNNRDFIDSFTVTIDIDEYLKVEYETLYSKRYDNIFESNYMSLVSWGENIFSDREIGFVVDDIQNLLDIMSNTIYKKWLNIIDCDYNAGFLSVFWKILYHQIFISRLSTIDTSAASNKHIREKFLHHGLSSDYENFLTEEEIIKIYLHIDKFMLNKGQKKVVDNFLKILKRKNQYPVIFNDINYGLFNKDLNPRITSDFAIRDKIEIFDNKKNLISESGEIFQDNNPNTKEPYIYSVNDLAFETKKKNNLRKLTEDTLIRFIKNGKDNSEYNININLKDEYSENELFTDPMNLYILSKYSLLKSKNDPLVRPSTLDNRILRANAGLDQIVHTQEVVTIYGDVSTGDIVSYKWKRIGGTGDKDIILNSVIDESILIFTADTLEVGSSDVTHIFKLTLNEDDETTISVSDTVTITILAPDLPNREPIANAGTDQIVISGQEVNLNGFKSRDPDGDTLRYSWARIDGTGNPNISLSNIRSINPSFIADTLRVSDLPVTHVFSLTVTDIKGETNTDKIMVTILPEENQPPVANAGHDDVVESGSTYRLNGTATTDPNANITSFLWTRIGGNGNPLIQITDQSTARPTVTFEDVTSTRTHIFRLTVIDSLGLSSTDTVTITVNSPNNPPIANAGEGRIVLQGSEVQLSGSATPGDGEITRYNWNSTQIPYTSITQDNSDPNCTFTAPILSSGENSRNLLFWLRVYDSNGLSHLDSTNIFVLRENTPPIANAGEDRIVGPLKTVILNGIESSDPNRKPLTYHWEQRTSGTGRSVNIESDREAIASFVTEGLNSGDEPITYVFALTVTDHLGDSHIDTVTITVDPDNVPPIANAGPDRTIISPSGFITLDGTGSTDDEEITSYEWIQIDDSGIFINLQDSMTSQARFTRIISPGQDRSIHKFLLTVTNSNGISDTDTVIITVLPRNRPPIADAGDNVTVPSGSNVILDGSRSNDLDGTITTYSWEQVGSSSVRLIGENTVNPIFTADTLSKTDSNVTHQFRLTVTDTNDEISTDTVYVTILAPENLPPIPIAGNDFSVNSGETVTLDGSRSNDPDGSITSYLWSVSGTPGDITLQNQNTAIASFVAPILIAGLESIIRTFVLTITDDNSISRTDTINITINPENSDPVSHAGLNRIVRSGDQVQLDGSGSYDTDGDDANLTYLWTQPSELVDNILTYRNIINPSFIAPEVTVQTVYIFQLLVTDSDGGTNTDTVNITVRPHGQNLPPVANAGGDRDVASGSTVTLDGSASTDLDLDRLSYNWERTGGTGRSNIQLLNTNGQVATFISDIVPVGGTKVTHEITLTVTDPSGENDSTTVTITVLPEEGESSGDSVNNAPPVANAGPDQTVNSGDNVQLDGSGYDPDFDPYIFNWRRSGGTSNRFINLDNPYIPNPTFTADHLTVGDSTVTHIFTLTISDIYGQEHEDSVIISINPPTNILPQADAGLNRTVKSNDIITLNGSNSNDPDGDDSNLIYNWEVTSGTGITLIYKNTKTPSFQSPILEPSSNSETFEITLTVTDEDGGISSDTITITVNAPPTVNAGDDQTVASGSQVHLSSSGTSDIIGYIDRYSWIHIGGSGSDNIVLSPSNINANPTFIADTLNPGDDDVTHIFKLIATDDIGNKNEDTVTITVNALAITLPIANAGPDQNAISETSIQLNASNSSDPIGREITNYHWERTGGNGDSNIALSSYDISNPTFIGDTLTPYMQPVTHVFTLTVSVRENNKYITHSDTVIITVSPVQSVVNPITNINPIANAGDDQTVVSGSEIILDGSNSSDPDDDDLIYHWTVLTRNGNYTLINSKTSTPTFIVDTLEVNDNSLIYKLRLTVTDINGGSSYDDINITVTPPEPVNSLPQADAGNDTTIQQTGSSNSQVSILLDGSRSQSGSDIDEIFRWNLIDISNLDYSLGYSFIEQNDFRSEFLLNSMPPGLNEITFTFSLFFRDSEGQVDVDTVNKTVIRYNAPTVISTPTIASIESGDTHTIVPTVTDPDGIASYRWTRTGGTGDPNIVLQNENTKDLTIIAETLSLGSSTVTHEFTLIVTDDRGSITESSIWSIYVRSLQSQGGVHGSSPPPLHPLPPPIIIPSDPINIIEEAEEITFNDLKKYIYKIGYINPEFDLNNLPEFLDINGDKKISTFLDKEEIFDEISIGHLNKIYNEALNGFTSRDQFLEYLNLSVATYSNILDKFVDVKNNHLKLKLFNKLLYTPTNETNKNTGFLIRSEDTTQDGYLEVDSIEINLNTTRREETFDQWLNKNESLSKFMKKFEEKRIENNDSLDIYLELYNKILYSLYGDLSYTLFNIDNEGLYKDDVGEVTELLTGYHFSNVKRKKNYSIKNTIDLNSNYASMDINFNINKRFNIDTQDNIINKTLISTTQEDGTNIRPIADAGDDQIVNSGSTVILKGTGSIDRDGEIISYLWKRKSGTGGNITLINAMTSTASFIADTLNIDDDPVTQVFTLTVTDDNNVTNSDVITITINPPTELNIPPISNAGPDQIVRSNALVELNGIQSKGNIVTYHWTRVNELSTGNRDILLIDSDKSIASFRAEVVIADQLPVTHVFRLLVENDKGVSDVDTVTITVDSSIQNFPPLANAGDDQEVLSGTLVTLSGSGTDEEDDDLDFTWSQLSGDSVTLSNTNTDVVTFNAPQLNPGSSSIVLVFRLVVHDSLGLSSTDTVTIIVNSLPIANRPPVANAGSDQNKASGSAVTLDGSASYDTDSDRGGYISSYQWRLISKSQNAIDPIFIPPEGNIVNPVFVAPQMTKGDDPIIYRFELKVIDNENDPDTNTVTITIHAPPVANAGDDKNVNSEDVFQLDANSSTGYGNLTYLWERRSGTGNPNIVLQNTNTATPTVTVEILSPGATSTTHLFEVTVTDELGQSTKDRITITVIAPEINTNPISIAGPDQLVDSGTLVTLDGSDSHDPELHSLTYAWVRLDDGISSSIVLSDSTARKPTFTADTIAIGRPNIVHRFRLTVTDQHGLANINTDTDVVTITVRPPNRNPVANILFSNVGINQLTGTRVILNGSTSYDPDGSNIPLTYLWERVSGTGDATIIDNIVKNRNTLSFQTDTLEDGTNAVTHRFKLTVTDDRNGSNSEFINVTVRSRVKVNLSPTASAGQNQTAKYGETVYLNGSGSDPDGDDANLTYLWTTDSTNITLSNTNIVNPTFVAPNLRNGNNFETGNITLTLTVTDTGTPRLTATSNVIITIEPPDNINPIANAGSAQSVNYGSEVTLNGSGSDPDDPNAELSYLWTSITNSEIIITNANMATATFIAPTPDKGTDAREYTFNLRVTDVRSGTHNSEVIITVSGRAPNQLPIANAGPNQSNIVQGTQVQLDGSNSTDPDGPDSELRYSWVRTGGTAGKTVTLSNPNIVNPTFIADTLTINDANVEHIFTLTVRDELGEHTSDVTISINAPINQPPVARAGENRTVMYNDTVTLDGSASTDLETSNIQLGYQWTNIYPEITLNNSGTSIASFTAPNLQNGNNFPSKTYTFTLTVTDSKGLTNVDTVDITVNPPRNVLPNPVTNGDQTVDYDSTVTLDATGTTDPDGPDNQLIYSWNKVGAQPRPLTLINANTSQASFVVPTPPKGTPTEIYQFGIRVTDVRGGISTDIVQITVNPRPANILPIANAGSNIQVNSGDAVTLTGTGTDEDNDDSTLTYLWRRLSTSTGSASLTFNGLTTDTVTFTAETLGHTDPSVTHTFGLVVSDTDGGSSIEDFVTVTVNAIPNNNPVAEAGNNRIVAHSTQITLNGSNSEDEDGSITSYAWTRIGGDGNSNILNGVTVNEATLTITTDTLTKEDMAVDHIFQLEVTDDDSATDTDTVTITVTPPENQLPVANAGPDRTIDSASVTNYAASPITVTLDGRSSSDPEMGTLTYHWARTGGTTGASVTLMNENTAQPSFETNIIYYKQSDGTLSTPVEHIFTLTVTDDEDDTDTDTVTITLNPIQNLYPTANAGEDINIRSGENFTLDGRGSSDPEGLPLQYRWSFRRPDSTLPSLFTPSRVGSEDQTTPTDTFTARTLNPGSPNDVYVYRLVLFDAEGLADVDDVTVTVYADNAPPTARAGNDQPNVASGATVTLDGSRTTDIDTDDSNLTYAWTRTGGTAGKSVTLTNENTSTATFIADILTKTDTPVVHIFTLTVTDDSTPPLSDTDMVTITINPPVNRPPISNAGNDQLNAVSGSIVTLDGSSSSDPDGDDNELTYAWTRSGGTAGKTVTLSNPNIVNPTFTADILYHYDTEVEHILTLTVTDEDNTVNENTDTNTVRIIVKPLANRRPVANAGNDIRVLAGEEFTLDGSGSSDPDPDDNDTLDYEWVRSNINNNNNGLSSIRPQSGFTKSPTRTLRAETLNAGADDVQYRFYLYVRDSSNAVSQLNNTSYVTVTVYSENASPTAEAGDNQEAQSGAQVQLNGSGIDIDGTIQSYRWIRTGGTPNKTVTLSNANIKNPIFTADTIDPGGEDIIHILELTVTDDENATDTDIVTITVKAPIRVNTIPIARAGNDITVTSGGQFELDGSSSSDPDDPNETLTYTWVRTGGTSTFVPIRIQNTDDYIFRAIAEVLLWSETRTITHIYTLTVMDEDGGSHDDEVQVTVLPPTRPANILPVASAGNNQNVASGSQVTIEGSGRDPDPDGSIVSYAWTRLRGNGRSDILNGVTVNEASLVYTTDTLLAGNSGKGIRSIRYNWHEFQLEVTDDRGGTDTNTVMISTFAPPRTEILEDQNVVSSREFTITSDESEFNRVNPTYAWTRLSGTGNVNILNGVTVNEASLTITADTLTAGGTNVTHTFQLTITDDLGQSSTDQIEITVIAPPLPNRAPASNAGPNQRKNSGTIVTLDGTGSEDPDTGDTLTYAWTQKSGTTVTLSSTIASQPTFTSPILASGSQDRILVFGLIVTDNHNVSSSEGTVEITINAPPLANATDNRTVASNTVVTINGVGTDNSNTNLTYTWTRLSGTGRSDILTNPAVVTNTNVLIFTSDTLTVGGTDVTHTFQLTVTDDDGLTDTDTIEITVEAPALNIAPVSIPGPDQIVQYADRQTVQLSGSAIDEDMDTLTYLWHRVGGTSGSNVVFSNANIKNPIVNAGVTSVIGSGYARHILRLTVTDSAGLWHRLAMNLFIVSQNQFTDVIDAGNKIYMAQNESIILTEAVGVENATYRWSIISAGRNRPNASLTNANTLKPTFTAPRNIRTNRDDEKYFLNFQVTKENGQVGNDVMEILVVRDETRIGNRPPYAHAGENRNVNSGSIVMLDGTASLDPDGSDTIYYSWERVGGTAGKSVILTGPDTSQPTFKADTVAAGESQILHTFELTVRDREIESEAASDTAQVRITINPSTNIRPVANAGDDRTVSPNSNVTLTGSGTDEGSIIKYVWRRVDGTGSSSIILNNATSRIANFISDTLVKNAASVTHRFGLIVTDNLNYESEEDFVTITVDPPLNQKPTANAGPDQLLLPTYTKNTSGQFVKTVVDLNGAGSSDPDIGDTLTYAWRMKSKSHSIGSDLIITDGTTSTPTTQQTTALEKGNNGSSNTNRRIVTYTAELIVTDSDDTASDPDTVDISFVAPPEINDLGISYIAESGKQYRLETNGNRWNTNTHSYLWERTSGTGRSNILDSVNTISSSLIVPAIYLDSLTSSDDSVTHNFRLTLTDGLNQVDIKNVTMTVVPPRLVNSEIASNAGSGQYGIKVGQTVTLSGSIQSGVNKTIQSYIWRQLNSLEVTLSDTSIANPTFTMPNTSYDLIFGLVLEYTDGTMSSEGTVVINRAILLTTSRGFAINSSTTSSLAGRSILTFTKVNNEVLNIYLGVFIAGYARFILTTTTKWTSEFISGDRNVPLFYEENDESPIYTIPASVNITMPTVIRISAHYEMVGHSNSRNTRTIDITINPPNNPPIARITHSVLSTTERTIQLDASASEDLDGSIIEYLWISSVTGTSLSSTTIVNPILTISSTYSHSTIVIFLTVKDNNNIYSERLRLVIPNPFTQSSPPSGTTGGAMGTLGTTVIFAGHDQLIYSGEEVILQAEIYTDIKVKSYTWTKVFSTRTTTISLTDANTKTATFTADTLSEGDADMIHTFLLTVTDKDDNIYTDNIRITVRDMSLKSLTIDAGSDQTVDSLATVTLNGSNSYIPDDVTVTYEWIILENPWIEITNGNQVSASFIAPIVVSTYQEAYKTYTAQLTITDDDENVYTDTILININRQSFTTNAPVAIISPNTLIVTSGSQVILDGSTSFDFESGTIVSYRWERIGGTSETELTFTGENTDTLTFTAETLTSRDVPVNYIIRLIVEDNLGNSDDAQISINITPPTDITPSTDLIARIGPNIYSYSGSTVTLDASGSQGTGLTYVWTRTGGTGNPNIMLSDPTSSTPTFTADIVTDPNSNGVTHLYTVTVTDSNSNTDTASIKITIYPIPI